MVRALGIVIESELRAENPAAAVRHAAELTTLEPFRESGYRLLMRAHAAAGNDAEALRVYEQCRSTLSEELGTYPSSETEAVYLGILRGAPRPKGSADVAPLSAPPATAPSRRRRIVDRPAAAVVAFIGLVAAVSGGALLVVIMVVARKSPAPTPVVRGDAVAVVDAATARLVGSVPVTSAPGAIAYADGTVWVSVPDSRSVARISAASQRVVGSVLLAVPAQSLAGAGAAVWAVGSAPTAPFLTLERIDAAFGIAATQRHLPTVVAGDSGSVVARGDTLLVAPRSGLLTRIDARNGRTLGQVDPNAAASAAAIGFGSSWLVYPEANLVIRVDRTGAITQIPVGRDPTAIAVGNHAVWVADALDGTLKPIDPATNSVITTIAVGRDPTAVAATGDTIWVAVAGDGKLVRVDQRTNRVTATVRTGGSPRSLVAAGGKIWASVQSPPPVRPTGGTAVVSLPSFITSLDPAVAFSWDSSQVEYATCAMLLNYPDEAGAAGRRLVPDAARALPAVSKDGRTYTFTIRSGLRFSPPSNQLVTAQTFKYTIERSLSPRMGVAGQGPPGQQFLADVVGAGAYAAGKARHIAGVQAHGNKLTIRLTHPAPDLPARIAIPLFCAVPTDMPFEPVRGPIPSAGPYYIASTTPRQGFVLLRNPNYHGSRPRRLRRIDVRIGVPHAVAQVEASHLDYAIDGVPAQEAGLLERRYGRGSAPARKGRQRYFVNRMLEVDYIQLNTKRPLFANPRMRRAVAYAVDRRALAAVGGTFFAAAAPAEMYLPPGTPGFRDARVYPLTRDLVTARRLAGSSHRQAELYCLLQGGSAEAAQVIATELAAIGLDVHVHCMPGDEMWARILRRNEPWDMVIDGWSADYNDPGDFLDNLESDGGFNVSHFQNAAVSRELRAASRLSGVRRAQAYARIDQRLVRVAAPWIAFANENAHDFFSARMGCQLYQPVYGIDLAALCVPRP